MAIRSCDTSYMLLELIWRLYVVYFTYGIRFQVERKFIKKTISNFCFSCIWVRGPNVALDMC